MLVPFRKTDEIVGTAYDGAMYCTDCVPTLDLDEFEFCRDAYPVFLGDAQGGDVCDMCRASLAD